MERLTSKYWRNLDPWEMCGQDNYCKRGCHDQGGCTKGCIVPRIYARLAAYEDTGVEPEDLNRAFNETAILKLAAQALGTTSDHLRDLIQADQDGRLVVLPCKVGDVVYGFHQERTILPMVAKWIETDADGWTVAAQYVPMAPKFYLFSDFGKTVFLTREEAEAALAQKGGTHEADSV